MMRTKKRRMSGRVSWSRLAGFACLYSLPSSAYALSQDTPGSLLDYAGALVGASYLSPAGGAGPSLRIEGGSQIWTHWGLGGWVGYGSFPINDLGYNSNTYSLAAEANYFLEEFVPGLRTQFKAGISYAHLTHLIAGPGVAYDYSLGDGYSLGAEAEVIGISSSPLGAATSFFASLHYWF